MDAIDIIQDILCLTLFGTEILEMADDLSQLLFSFANYSNFYAVVTILFCFVTTAVLILRFNNDLLQFPVMGPLPPNTATKRPMMGHTNPFSVQLTESSSASLKDGFTLSVSSLTEGQLAIYWGPSIDTVYEILQWSAQKLLDSLTMGCLLDGSDECLFSQLNISLGQNENKNIHIDCPDGVDELSLGYSPRQRYPCVVVAAVLHTAQNMDEVPAVVASFTMIHLRDSVVTLESQIVGQFLKLSDNRVYNLQPVFLATDHDQSNKPSPTEKNLTTKSNSAEGRLQERDAACVTTTNTPSESSGDQCSEEDVCDMSCDKDIELCNTKTNCPSDNNRFLSSGDRNSTTASISGLHGYEKAEESLAGEFKSSRISQDGKLTDAEAIHSQNIQILRCTNLPLENEMANLETSLVHCSDLSSQSSGSVSSEYYSDSLRTALSQENSNKECVHPESLECVDPESPERVEPEGLERVDPESPECVDPEGPECVVCQMNSISHVILPCRHACICGLCFKKIDRCPMCRGYIDTYFTLFDDGEVEPDSPETEQTVRDEAGFVAWINSLNDRLNEYLGLT